MIFTKMYGKNRKRICNFINIAKKILVKITTLHIYYIKNYNIPTCLVSKHLNKLYLKTKSLVILQKLVAEKKL